MQTSSSYIVEAGPFSADEREAVYRAIFTRRDVRSQFLPQAIPADVLNRLLFAAHHAPSVGFMQPWNFIIITKPKVKHQIKEAFKKANCEAAELFQDERLPKLPWPQFEGDGLCSG